MEKRVVKLLAGAQRTAITERHTALCIVDYFDLGLG
jgi:hypothetical protein